MKKTNGGTAMKKIFPRYWEKMNNFTYRMPVPGGWIVNVQNSFEESCAEALCFVPDPNHEWELDGDYPKAKL